MLPHPKILLCEVLLEKNSQKILHLEAKISDEANQIMTLQNTIKEQNKIKFTLNEESKKNTN